MNIFLRSIAAVLVVVLLIEKASGEGRLRRVKEENGGQQSLLAGYDYSFYQPPTTAAPRPTTRPTTRPSPRPSTFAPPVSPAPSPKISVSHKFVSLSGGNRTMMIKILYGMDAQQNAWHLFKGADVLTDAIYSVDFGTQKSWQLVRTTFRNLAPGQYTFALADIGNNGLPGGSISIWQIKGQNSTLLWEHNGKFDFLVEKKFYLT